MQRVVTSLSVVLSASLLGGEHASAQVGACFDLETVGPWVLVSSPTTAQSERIPPNEGGDSLNLTPPSRIRLDETSISFPAGWSAIVVPDNSLQTPHAHKTWRVVRDSLNVVFSSGFSGTGGILAPEGAGWRGKLRNFSDAIPFTVWERQVELIPVDCGAAPRYPASLDRVLPRSVDLTSGESIVLGQPLPAGLTTTVRPSGALSVVGQTTGIFAGTNQIIVSTSGPGVVDRIELHYEASFDLAALGRALEERFGSPRGMGSMSWRWQNRTTTVYGFPSPAPNRPARMVFIDPRYR
jgi:hypothetical protein